MAQRERISRKSVAIVGEGLTEFRYMDALRTTERYHFKLVPGMPKHSDIDDMVSMAQKRVAEGYDYVICLVDMDVILSNASKLSHYKKLKKDNPQILFVESNACTEYWFLMHFMSSPSSKEYPTYESIVRDLRKHLPIYDKTEAYFNKTNIYKELKDKGNLPNAIKLSKKLDELRERDADTYKSYSQMHLLFDILDSLNSAPLFNKQ